MDKRVTVVGAGFAGLACARSLVSAGIEVSVLEARDRVGGRIWSQELGNGITVERGGEFVMENYTRLPELAQELGLELASHGAAFADREIRDDGAPNRRAMIEAAGRLAGHFEDVLEAAEGPISMADAIQSSPLGAWEKRALHARLTGTITTDLAGVDLAWVGATSAHDGSVGFAAPRYVIGGNQRIALRIAERLGDRVALRSPVASLDQTGDQVQAKLDNGTIVASDAAVIAVPPTIIRKLGFAPALPELQALAYDTVGFGVASKLSVGLEQPVPPLVIQEVTAPFSIYTSALPDGSDPSALTLFAGSPGAQQELALGHSNPHVWLERLARVRPEVLTTGEPILTEWINEPWTGGSYSFRPVGWSAERERALGAPFGRIAFAGEQTAPMEVAASMEGALRSGERAAEEVIELLQHGSVAALAP